MYLTRKALEETLEAARSIAAPGSEIAMDFWFLPDAHDWQSTARRIVPNLLHLVGEPLVMSLHPDDCAGFLARVGFDLVDLAGHRELEATPRARPAIVSGVLRDLCAREERSIVRHDSRDAVHETLWVRHDGSRRASTSHRAAGC